MNIRTIASLLLVSLTIFAAVLPEMADARAGGGFSSGSRGSRTYSAPSGAAPIQRSTTPQRQNTTPNQPYQQPAAPMGGFGRGLLGGFLGAGLFSMLFGGWGGGGGGIGLLPLLLIAGLVYFFFRRMQQGQGFTASPPASGGYYDSQEPVNTQPLAVTDADKAEFEQTLYRIQHNWSEGDLARLRQFVTPEMLHYFSEQLSVNSSRGLANKVEQVQLLHAEIVEAWHEYNMDYATARLQWSALDYMARLDRSPMDGDYVASGSHNIPETVGEIWTFVRASGGHWLLSAIQQVA